jgi:hypothetical protein
MCEIRIVSGAYGMNVNGRIVVVRSQQTCEVPEEEAARLVKLGVAVYVKEPVLVAETPAVGDAEDETGDTPEAEEIDATEDLIPGHLDEEELRKMPFDQLKKLAVDCGLQVGKLRSRENIVKALAEMDTFVSAEEDGEEPPIMEAEAPVR